MKQNSIHNFHYGNLRRDYLKSEYPRTYQILLMTGQLPRHLKSIQKQAMNMRKQLSKQMTGESSLNFLMNVQNLRETEHTIEEMVLTKVVYQPYETTV
ncbi:MAG: TnpV protein [Clostridiales bacterium]|nr:TnpV protein [Clostridiales bacterium]